MKKEKNKRYDGGITLIALVVTVVVLIIIAGVTLSLTIGNGGIMKRAKEAKERYGQASKNEQKDLDTVEDYMNKMTVGETTGGGSGSTVDGVPIPEGYYYVGGTKAKGLVISDNVADKELDKGKEDVRRDLDGNQWVWVPVDSSTLSSMCVTSADTVALSGNVEVTTNIYSNSTIPSKSFFLTLSISS